MFISLSTQWLSQFIQEIWLEFVERSFQCWWGISEELIKARMMIIYVNNFIGDFYVINNLILILVIKPFDTEDHVILLRRLAHYGIRGTALKWFESYLSNWEQYVTHNGISSSKQRIKCGVPQGSILGPLLFFIYINDLCLVCKHTSAIPFADDTNLFSSGKDLKTLESTTNNELSNISSWPNLNELSRNIKKTHYMIFCTRKKLYHNVKLLMDRP